MDHGVSKIVPLLGCHVTLLPKVNRSVRRTGQADVPLPDIVNTAGHEDAPGSLAPEDRDHVAALDRLDLPSGMVEAGEPGWDVSVTRVSQPSPAEGSCSPGEHLPELVHQRGVVGPGRDVSDSHHLHQLGLLGLGVSLVHASNLEGRGDPGVPGEGQVSNS